MGSSQSTETARSLLDLPDELLVHILRPIAGYWTLCNVRLTCKRLRRVAADPKLRPQIRIRVYTCTVPLRPAQVFIYEHDEPAKPTQLIWLTELRRGGCPEWMDLKKVLDCWCIK